MKAFQMSDVVKVIERAIEVNEESIALHQAHIMILNVAPSGAFRPGEVAQKIQEIKLYMGHVINSVIAWRVKLDEMRPRLAETLHLPETQIANLERLNTQKDAENQRLRGILGIPPNV